MTIKQVGFEDLLNKTDSKSKNKKSGNSEVKKNTAKTSAAKTKAKKITTAKPAAKQKNSKPGQSAGNRKSSPKKVSFTQDDMDKLCEIYDWYLLVKDLAPLKTINLSDKSTKIDLENDIVKESKRVTINIDKQVWDDFNALCSNIGEKRNEVLTQVIKDFINNHKDLV